jgi:putative OPT family oligopeptide transporter
MMPSRGLDLTLRSVGLGFMLAVILGAANAYLGLFAGLTVSASIPASVLAMALLRGEHNKIREANVVQTAASAGESLAAGVIFTFPALLLLGVWQDFNYTWVAAIASIGGLLGVFFTIPLRRSLIVEENLPFPEGTATAEVLRAGERPDGAGGLIRAGMIGGVMKIAGSGLGLWPSATGMSVLLKGMPFQFRMALSPALLAVGYIVGLRVALPMFIGGAFAWLIAIPLYSHVQSPPAPIAIGDWASLIWSTRIRYMGVGAMLVGGLWALLKLITPLARSIKTGLATPARFNSSSIEDLPLTWVSLSVLLLTVPIYYLYLQIVHSVLVAGVMTLLMIIMGFLFSAIAGYMAGLVGSSNNPISGVTIATLLLTSLILLALLGGNHAVGPGAAILVGAIVCCAAAIGGDNMQDLKAGHLIGSIPWQLQLAQMLGVLAGALVMAPILNLLLHAYGFGAPDAQHPHALAAPQAVLMTAVTRGVFVGDLPWMMVGVGVAIGILVIFTNQFLERRYGLNLPVLAVAVGIYLPIELTAPMLLGGLMAYGGTRRSSEPTSTEPGGLLVAAGLITGEALAGIVLAVPVALRGDPEVMAIVTHPPLGAWPGFLLLLGLASWLRHLRTRPLSSV